MIRNASFRSKGSNSETTDDSNAYAAADDWTADDLGTLSSNIQQHATNIAGRDNHDDDDDDGADDGTVGGGGGDGFLDEELESRPIQSLVGSDGTGASARSFTSFGRDGDSVTGGGGFVDPRKAYGQQRPKSVLRSNRRYGGGGIMVGDYNNNNNNNNNNDDGSVHSRVSFSANTKRPRVYAAYHPTKHGTKIRAAIALCCLVGSIVLAVLWGHGTAGLWIARTVVGAPGTTAVKEGPTTDGIPGPLGVAQPAFNGTFEIPDLVAMDIVLGPDLENLADWRIPFPAANRTDLPIFWDIQRSGGTAVRRILGQCLGLVEVSQEGASHTEPALQIFETPQGTRYVNVDSTTAEGLQRAKDLELPRSGLADVLFTSLVWDSLGMFFPPHQGRLFAVFRHPLDRAMSVYSFAQSSDPAVGTMSLADFARDLLPNNEMVRALSNRGPQEDLTDNDLYLAMEVLRRKCVVGLVDRMEESMVRFHGYFGWYSLVVDGVTQCQATYLLPNEERVPAPAQGSDAYNIMINQNRLDLRLYEYARYLYDVQGGTVQET